MSGLAMSSALGEAPAITGQRTIPFDYSFAYDLTGQPERTHSRTVTISIEGPFTAVFIGYGVVPRAMPLRFGPAFKSDFPGGATPPATPPGGTPIPIIAMTTATQPVAALSAPLAGPKLATLTRANVFEAITGVARPGRLPTSVATPEQPLPLPKKGDEAPPVKFKNLTLQNVLLAFRRAVFASPRFLKGAANFDEVFRSGFRVRPDVLDRVLLNDGDIELDVDTLAELFEVVATPQEQMVFLYSIHDEGTGRAFQSEPVLSIAGLGISNGDRPFRRFATPIVFAPQTTIRLDVTEKSEFNGQLFISLQGYKQLGQPGAPTAVRRR